MVPYEFQHPYSSFSLCFKYVKLKYTYNTNNNFFHSGIIFLEYLNSTFLSYLGNTFYELFSLHCIYLSYFCKMFWCKCWNSFILKFLIWQT